MNMGEVEAKDRPCWPSIWAMLSVNPAHVAEPSRAEVRKWFRKAESSCSSFHKNTTHYYGIMLEDLCPKEGFRTYETSTCRRSTIIEMGRRHP